MESRLKEVSLHSKSKNGTVSLFCNESDTGSSFIITYDNYINPSQPIFSVKERSTIISNKQTPFDYFSIPIL